jgi:branched-chain amino acid transport system substrate-binding protein
MIDAHFRSIGLHELLKVILALLLAACAGCSRGGSTEPLWLGHVAPMSGADKAAGDHARQGVRIAVEGLNNSEGLVLGRKIAVRHADAKTDARNAEAEAVRLASVNHVIALLGGTDTLQAEQIARGAESAGVPAVLQAPLLATNDNAYSIVPSLARRGQVLGKYAATSAKWNSIAILMDERSRTAGPVVDAFVKEFPQAGARRFSFKKADESAAKNGDPLTDALANVAAAKAQAVLFAGSAADLPRVRAELLKALPAATIVFAGDQGDILDNARDGIVMATSYVASDETSANQAFVAKYQEQFHEPPDVNAALAYDGTQLLADVVRKAGTTNAAKLREVLQQLESFESVTGTARFGKDRHARRPLFVVQIENGRPMLRKRFGPDD